MIEMPELRLPASTPLVSVSAILVPMQVVLIDGAQFADGRRRAVVGTGLSAETAAAIEESLIEHERIDGMRRWISDMLAHKPKDQSHAESRGPFDTIARLLVEPDHTDGSKAMDEDTEMIEEIIAAWRADTDWEQFGRDVGAILTAHGFAPGTKPGRTGVVKVTTGMVEAALNAWRNEWHNSDVEAMHAALEAALGATERRCVEPGCTTFPDATWDRCAVHQASRESADPSDDGQDGLSNWAEDVGYQDHANGRSER